MEELFVSLLCDSTFQIKERERGERDRERETEKKETHYDKVVPCGGNEFWGSC